MNKNINDPYGIRDTQLYLLDVLKDIDAFCRSHDIKYSINGGTLLGAVRHKGFIPWDDDADIMFDRDNYKKFLTCAVASLPDEYVIIGDTWLKRVTKKSNPGIENDEGCVDLFVMDAIPKDSNLERKKNFWLKVLQGMLKKKVDYSQYSLKNRILIATTHIMGLPFSTEFKQRKYDEISQWGNDSSYSKMNIFNSLFRQIGLFEYTADMMEKYIDLEFEDTKLMAIADYDQYLSVAYGNYMELPPENQRKPMHVRKGY